MTSRAEERSDNSMDLDKALGVPDGFEPAHSPLPLTRRLMRVLRPVVQVPVLPVSNAGHDHSLSCRVTAQLIRHDHAWTSPPGCAQQPSEEPHGRKTVAFRLDENVDHNTILVDGSPEIMPHTIDVEKDLVQMPFVARSRTPLPQAIGIPLAELVAPAPDRFIADYHTSRGHQFFHITKADTESEVQPHAIGDDLLRKPIAMVRVARHSSGSHSATNRQCDNAV